MQIATGDLVSGDRPRRDRAQEAAEIRRRELQDLGLCIDCEEPSRTQRCTKCSREKEANTVRDLGKRACRGRLTKSDDTRLDAKLELREQADGFAMLEEAQRLRRSRERDEAIRQARAKITLGIAFANHIIEKLGGG